MTIFICDKCQRSYGIVGACTCEIPIDMCALGTPNRCPYAIDGVEKVPDWKVWR